MGVIIDCHIGVLVANNAWIGVMGMKTTKVDDEIIGSIWNEKYKNKRTNITT
jgi:hypothetical protein